jgi:hypothetical protein
VQDSANRTVAILTARTPGTYGNDIRILTSAATEPCRIDRETHTTAFDRLNYFQVVPSAQNRIQVFRPANRRTDTFNIVYRRVVRDERVPPGAGGRFFLANTPIVNVASVNHVQVQASDGSVVREYGDGDILFGAGAPPGNDEVRLVNNADTTELIFAAAQVPTADQIVVATYALDHAAPTSGQVLVTNWDGTLTFFTGEAPQQANGDRLIATYLVDAANCVQVSLSLSPATERYTVPDGRVLADQVTQSSQLVTGVADATNGNRLPRADIDSFFGTGSNTPGNNGADANADDYATGLSAIANVLVNIVVLAGQDARTMGSTLLGHLSATEESDFERIGVIGAPGNTVADFLGHTMASERVVLVAPGIADPNGPSLSPAYMAAAVAGLIASLPVQTSLTNKEINVPALTLRANRGEQAQLIGRDVLTVIEKNGFRILKGVTTAGEGTPFSSIPTRRIVDFAKYGVRSAANPYIGRLNNTRVRAALKSTLDAFLTRMVEDEALTGYDLDVTATRAQEIAGEVSVVMTLQPTFSIEFIRVIMNLK